jgi:hypothetical protein
MADWQVRVRRLVDDYAVPVVGMLVVVVVLGGYVTYVSHVDPGTETEVVEDASWSSTAQYSHQAQVTTNTSVFDRGTVLQNRGSYLTAVAPVLNGTFSYRYEATDGGDLQVGTDHVLVLRSVSEGEGQDIVEYWRIEEDLNATSADSVGPGDTVDTAFALNVSDVNRRLDSIDEELGGTPGQTAVLVQTRVTLSGTRNGQPVNQTRTYEMRIDTQQNVYSVGNDGPQTNSGEQTREVTVEATYGPVRTVGAPLLALVSLLGAFVVAGGHWQGVFDVTDAERTQLDYTSAYQEYEDWISTAHVPDSALTGPQVAVETLGGLVDVAIDSNRRVLEDQDRGLCVVLVDDVTYVYEIPSVHEADPLTADPDPDSPAGEPDDTPDQSQ